MSDFLRHIKNKYVLEINDFKDFNLFVGLLGWWYCVVESTLSMVVTIGGGGGSYMVVSVVVQRSAFFQTGGFVSFDSRLAALSASLSPPSTQQQHSDRAAAAAAARSSLGPVQWQVLLLLTMIWTEQRGDKVHLFSSLFFGDWLHRAQQWACFDQSGGLERWGESCSSPSLVCLLSSTVR